MRVNMYIVVLVLRRSRWRLAGAELGSRVSQGFPNRHCERVRAAKYAPRGRFDLLNRRHGLTEIVERGGGVPVKHHRVDPPRPERRVLILSKNASSHGNSFAQHRFGFFEALYPEKGHRAVVGCGEGRFM